MQNGRTVTSKILVRKQTSVFVIEKEFTENEQTTIVKKSRVYLEINYVSKTYSIKNENNKAEFIFGERYCHNSAQWKATCLAIQDAIRVGECEIEDIIEAEKIEKEQLELKAKRID